jgi:hypothetical protein
MANGNGSVAPVCPVSRGQSPPGMRPTQAPQIPQAVDLPSAIAALAQMILAQQLPQVTANNVAPPYAAPLPGSGTTGAGTSKKPGWLEIGRNLEPHRIYNPDDDSVFVTLNRITFLLFQERKTQVTLEWDLGYGQID